MYGHVILWSIKKEGSHAFNCLMNCLCTKMHTNTHIHKQHIMHFQMNNWGSVCLFFFSFFVGKRSNRMTVLLTLIGID